MGAPAKRTKGELDFINEKTRELLCEWAHRQVQGLPVKFGVSDLVFVEHAITKNWLSKAEPRKVTSSGFKTAAAFLRR